MDFWIGLTQELRRSGFNSGLRRQLVTRLARIEPAELVAMSARQLVELVAPTGVNFTSTQARLFLELAKNVFERLEAAARLAPAAQGTFTKFTFRFRDADKAGKPRVANLRIRVSIQNKRIAQNVDLFKGHTNEQGEIRFQTSAAQPAVTVRVVASGLRSRNASNQDAQVEQECAGGDN